MRVVERPALNAFETLGWDVIDQQRQQWTDPRESKITAVLEPCLHSSQFNPF